MWPAAAIRVHWPSWSVSHQVAYSELESEGLLFSAYSATLGIIKFSSWWYLIPSLLPGPPAVSRRRGATITVALPGWTPRHSGTTPPSCRTRNELREIFKLSSSSGARTCFKLQWLAARDSDFAGAARIRWCHPSHPGHPSHPISYTYEIISVGCNVLYDFQNGAV